MHKPIWIFFTALLAMVDLSSPAPRLGAQQPVEAPNAPAHIPALNITSTASVPRTYMIRAVQRLNYVCAGNNEVTVRLHGTNARVNFQNQIFSMKQVEATSGTKYSDASTAWWIQGQEGGLGDDSKPGSSVMLAENCQLQQNNPGKKTAATSIATVSGTVTYLQRISLPPEAEIIVQLQDVSRPDAGARIVAEEIIAVGQRQVPIPFELKFDPAKIDSAHSYAVTARIFTESRLRFMNSKSYRVLTQGYPAKANLVVIPVEPAQPPSE